MAERRRAPAVLEWAVSVRPFPGEGVSGDRHAVILRGATAVVAVIDALGHGSAAESTARKASVVLERHAGEPIPLLIARCHAALQGDRGVVMTVASIDGTRDVMAWAGVGNIRACVLGSTRGNRKRRERLVSPAGIIGARLPELRASVVQLSPGDILMFATDGVRDGFAEDFRPGGEDLQQLAERLILDHATRTDDALVLVGRYLGGA